MHPAAERAWTLLEQTRAGTDLDTRWREARAAFGDYGETGVNAAWFAAFFAAQALAQVHKEDPDDAIGLAPNPDITPEMARLFGNRARAGAAWHEAWFLIAATASLGHPEGAQQHDISHLARKYASSYKGGGIFVLIELAAHALAGLEEAATGSTEDALSDLRESLEGFAGGSDDA